MVETPGLAHVPLRASACAIHKFSQLGVLLLQRRVLRSQSKVLLLGDRKLPLGRVRCVVQIRQVDLI